MSASQKQNRKGQLFTADAVFAILFALSLFALYSSASKASAARASLGEGQASLADAAETGMAAIFSADAAVGASLRTNDGFFSSEKISAFSKLEREQRRELLGLYRQGGSHDFSLLIADFRGNDVARLSSSPQPELGSALSLTRFGVLDDGKPIRITFTVWEK